MLVNEKVAVEHGLKADEYKKICDLLSRTPNLTELGIFLLCGMSTALINHQGFI